MSGPDGAAPLVAALDRIAEDEEFVSICPLLVEPGHPRLLLITGENAGGKTFVSGYLGQVLRLDHEGPEKIEVMDIGMRRRTESGFGRSLIFGDESWESTGQISVKAITGAIRTSKGRENAHLIVLDEPDIGLSESYQHAVGELLAEFADEMPERMTGLVIVTHSRPLARALMRLAPTCVRVGDDLRPTGEWLEHGPLPRNAEDVKGLQETALTRFRGLSALIRKRSEDRRRFDAPSP